jgi:hypothetical protein
MPRFWILPVLGLIAALGFACGDSGDDLPSAKAIATSVTTSPAATATASTATDSSKPSVTPIGSWITYTDDAAGFSMPIPDGAVRKEQTIDLPAKGGYPVVPQKLTGFVDKDGIGLVGVSITPNPAGLKLENWIQTYPGWTTDPTSVMVDGEQGLRFSRSVLGEPADFVFVQHGGSIFELSGNVYGSGEGGYGPTITKADFDLVISGFRYAK